MDRTNSQRQARFRERLKERLKVAEPPELVALRQAFEAARQAYEEYTPYDFLAEEFGDSSGFEIIGPMLCAALGLPRDPWPGLTAKELDAMLERKGVKWRRQRRFPGLRLADLDLTFTAKFMASRYMAELTAPKHRVRRRA